MSSPDLPTGFIQQIQTQIGAAASAFLATYTQPSAHALRINAARTTLAALASRTGWDLEPVPWCPTGAYVDPVHKPGAHPFHAAGLYYLQEPSAMAVAELADLSPGQTVLDLAASPGGKSTQIASAVGPDGLLIANEIHPARIKALGENLERWGVANTIITNRTPDSLAVLGPVFDRVIVDAPCSGEGLFRRDPGSRREWSPERVHGCAARQRDILEPVASLVRPGGRLVYSTCTFNETENEHVIEQFTAAHPEFTVDLIQRLWPHEVRGEGHTIHRLVRTGSTESSGLGHAPGFVPYSGDAWDRFTSETFATNPFPTDIPRIAEQNGRVILMPLHPILSRIGPTVRTGLWLGDIRPGRFEPSHALALAVDPAIVRNRIDLSVAEAQSWIAGNPVQQDGSQGWVLMTVEGFGLGWGKRTGSTVKNHYPKGLRRPPSAYV